MDMFFFMFMLSIWVVAYGVAKQGILIHNDNRLDWIIRGVVYEPYLVIFGTFPRNIDCKCKYTYIAFFIVKTLRSWCRENLLNITTKNRWDAV